MSVQEIGVVAGMFSTAVFVGSYLPMLVKAGRTKDLRSYSAGNLVIANVGNVIHSVYVFSLPAGPLWGLHAFYTVSTALMLVWYVQHRRGVRSEPPVADELTAVHPTHHLDVVAVVAGGDT